MNLDLSTFFIFLILYFLCCLFIGLCCVALRLLVARVLLDFADRFWPVWSSSSMTGPAAARDFIYNFCVPAFPAVSYRYVPFSF